MSARDAVTGLLAAVDAHDPDAVVSRFAEQVVVRIPAIGVYEGVRADLEVFFADLLRAFPDLRVNVKRVVVTGDAVTAEVNVEGTQDDAYLGAINQEKHLDVDEAWRFEITDGLVSGFEGYWCQQALYRRLGVKRLDRIALV
ncbi:nuclear transport factor 2 family protein [Nocardia miyunensis]|uniref:nuclear transport factor 2 family protein n=1 Tax=Nocardia miyunensis TaxID=282684 RepID=UPI000A021329|nr:nuclear transport factor 2 family protein [Nocardia miyunensis]